MAKMKRAKPKTSHDSTRFTHPLAGHTPAATGGVRGVRSLTTHPLAGHAPTTTGRYGGKKVHGLKVTSKSSDSS